MTRDARMRRDAQTTRGNRATRFAGALIASLALLLLGATATPEPAAAQTLCDNPQETCGRIVPPKCLSRIGAGSLAAGDDCAPAAVSYRECLALAAETCNTASARAPEPQAQAAPSGAPGETVRRVGRRGDVQVTLIGCSAFDVNMTCDFELDTLSDEKDDYWVNARYNIFPSSTATLPGADAPVEALDAFLKGGDARTYVRTDVKSGTAARFSIGFQAPGIRDLPTGAQLPQIVVSLRHKGFVHSAVFENVAVAR